MMNSLQDCRIMSVRSADKAFARRMKRPMCLKPGKYYMIIERLDSGVMSIIPAVNTDHGFPFKQYRLIETVFIEN